MKRSVDNTHSCRSATPTVNGGDLTYRHGHKPLSRNTVTWRPVTGGHQHSTPATFPKAFHKEPGLALSSGRQSMRRRLWHTLKISKKFSGEWMFSVLLVCNDTTGTQTALGIIQLWFTYFAASFFKALGNLNHNRLKIPKKHCKPQKGPRGSPACLRPLT